MTEAFSTNISPPGRDRHLPSHTFEMDDSSAGHFSPGRTMLEQNTVQATVQRSNTTSAGGAKATTRHTLGLLLLLLVVLLWTASNFLGSSIFADNSYAKPFFLTYLNTSMFMVAMIPTLLISMYRRYQDNTLRSSLRAVFTVKTYRPLWSSKVVQSESETFLKPDQEQDHDLDGLSNSALLETKPGTLGIIETARLAMAFCILWFAANYFAMSCLQYTTVASTTILTSTSSVWTLLIGALTGIEKFTWRKLLGVFASLVGIVLISRVDFSAQPDGITDPSGSFSDNAIERIASKSLFPRGPINPFPDKSASELVFGDLLALLSAVIYGLYTITLKKTSVAAAPLELDMTVFFGLVGFFNFIFLLPVFPILHLTGLETFQLPPSSRIWIILLINSVASLLSDICWAYAMVMTSPLLVTVGLSLTIPLSLVGEMVLQSRYEGWLYWIGALVVVASFVFVEREESKEEIEGEQQQQQYDDHQSSSRIVHDRNRDAGSREGEVEYDATTRLLVDEDQIDKDIEAGPTSNRNRPHHTNHTNKSNNPINQHHRRSSETSYDSITKSNDDFRIPPSSSKKSTPRIS